jgi:hypothetical protein
LLRVSPTTRDNQDKNASKNNVPALNQTVYYNFKHTEKKKKQTWFLAFHHLSGAKIVPSSALQPTPVSKINLFHILQYFLIPSHLFFNCAFVNAWPV